MSETTTTTPRRPRQLDQRLTDQQLADLVTRERPYKVFDGNSLFVLVTPSGQRSWRWRYYIRGREKVLLLGSYPDVSLEQARAARDQARDKVQAGIDPADEKREAKLALLIAQESSFEAVARAWHSRWATGRHARYAEDVMSGLERNVFPVLGHKSVDQIEPKHIVAMMERVQGRGATDVARRVRNTCSQVFRYSFASEKDVKAAFAKFLDVSNVSETIKTLLVEYEKICQLRHCCVHRFGKLGTQNGIVLGLEQHSGALEKPLSLDVQTLGDIAWWLMSFSKAMNNYMFKTLLERSVSEKNPYKVTWTWSYSKDRAKFERFYKLFHTSKDANVSPSAEELYGRFKSAKQPRKAKPKKN